MKKKIRIFLAVFVGIFYSASVVFAETPEEVIRASEGVVEIRRRIRTKFILEEEEVVIKEETGGTGFFIGENLVLSALHNFEPSSGPILGLTATVYIRDKGHRASVIAFDAQHDLVLLKVPDVFDMPDIIEFADIRDTRELKTEGNYIVGFPRGLGKKHVDPIYIVGIDGIDGFETPSMIVLGVASPGMSGGPILDSKGKAIGMTIAIGKDAEGKPIPLVFAVPSPIILSFLERVEGEEELKKE